MIIKIFLLFINLTFAKVNIAVVDNFETQHGEQVSSIISKKSKNSLITQFHVDFKDFSKYLNILKEISNKSFDILNLSHGQVDYSLEESILLQKIAQNGTIIVVASGNDNSRIDKKNTIYPCQLKIKNLFCIGSSENMTKSSLSNFGPSVSFFISGQFYGKNVSSFAAPNFSALISHFLDKDIDLFLKSLSFQTMYRNESIFLVDFDKIIELIRFEKKFKKQL